MNERIRRKTVLMLNDSRCADWSVSYQVSEDFDIFGKVTNLGDEKYAVSDLSCLVLVHLAYSRSVLLTDFEIQTPIEFVV